MPFSLIFLSTPAAGMYFTVAAFPDTIKLLWMQPEADFFCAGRVVHGYQFPGANALPGGARSFLGGGLPPDALG
jgi:hypothetical protein